MIPSPLLVVTDRHGSARPLVETVSQALEGGARWIWLRDRDLPPDARHRLAVDLLALVRLAGGKLSIGADIDLARAIGADGVHLGGLVGETDNQPSHPSTGDRPSLSQRVTAARGALGREGLIGISAHSLGDIRAAAEAGADYATLSPIFPTSSKPGYGPALGLKGLEAASRAGLPVLALGGVAAGNAAACLSAGAAGIAVMGCVMRASEPAPATSAILGFLR